MAFDYKKNKSGEDSGSFWTSYSDLFLGMSVVFLLLYVTASLRQGTNGIQQQLQNQKLTTQVQDLKNQLKMYDSVKQDYLKNEAKPEDEKLYAELMDKITLLKEDAKNEKNDLTQKASENEKKEKALNQYQQMVRNIVNANLLAKTKMKRREDVIGKQDVKIDNQGTEINSLEKNVSQKEALIASNENKITAANEKLKLKLKELKSSWKLKEMSDAAYEKKVESLKGSNQKKIAQLKSTTAAMENQLADVQGKLGQVAGELDQAKGSLGKAEAENKGLEGKLHSTVAGYNAKMGALRGSLKDTEGLLAHARAEADARKQIAKDIRSGFAKAGVSADINENTGEVVINFGDAYFDNDSTKLKERMKEVLKKAMPVYSKSLLGDKKIASKIAAVEIIGFASPTYRGKYVDPKAINTEEGKNAIDYNLDLSYGRARSIFKFVFDESKISFEHQKDMLPLIKVTGRSFLAEKLPETSTRKPTNANRGDFCASHDCQKAQRVIIRFSFEDKK